MKKAYLFFCLLLPLVALTQITLPLYRIEKSVTTEQEKERNQLLPTAMSDVLVKVSGDRSIVDNVDLQTMLQEKANIALQRFRYLNQGDQKKLELFFSESAIKSILTHFHLTFWPNERPEIVVWIVYQDPEEKQWEFVTEDVKSNFMASLKRQAEWRGLPVHFPVLDLQEMQSLDNTYPAKKQVNAFETLSKRYHPDGVLLVSISQDSANGFKSYWDFHNDSEQVHWHFNGKNIVEIFTQGVDAVSDMLVERSALLLEEQKEKSARKKLSFSVSGVNSIQDYLKTMHYLKKLSGVEGIDITSITGDTVHFSILLGSDFSKKELKEKIQKENILIAVEDNKENTNIGTSFSLISGQKPEEATA